LKVEARLSEEVCQLRAKDTELEQLIYQLRERQESVTAAEAVRSSAVEEKIQLNEDTVQRITEQIVKLEAEANQLTTANQDQVCTTKPYNNKKYK
jgi:RNA:NAD 2'-phosphotransferase (TPT1/KptA family)